MDVQKRSQSVNGEVTAHAPVPLWQELGSDTGLLETGACINIGYMSSQLTWALFTRLRGVGAGRSPSLLHRVLTQPSQVSFVLPPQDSTAAMSSIHMCPQSPEASRGCHLCGTLFLTTLVPCSRRRVAFELLPSQSGLLPSCHSAGHLPVSQVHYPLLQMCPGSHTPHFTQRPEACLCLVTLLGQSLQEPELSVQWPLSSVDLRGSTTRS